MIPIPGMLCAESFEAVVFHSETVICHSDVYVFKEIAFKNINMCLKHACSSPLFCPAMALCNMTFHDLSVRD